MATKSGAVSRANTAPPNSSPSRSISIFSKPSCAGCPPARHEKQSFNAKVAKDAQRTQWIPSLRVLCASLATFALRFYLMSPAKILAVDDEADFELLIRQRFRRQIRAQEFAFSFAHHGEEALAALAEDPDIELLLLDINMPVMDGLTLLAEMRERL